jgi:hypothetical protein
MWFFPYDSFIIRTKLSKIDLQKILYSIVGPQDLWRSFRKVPNNKPYEGKIEDGKFKLSRIINYRNPFLPIIQGKISPNNNGNKISITMRPNGFSIALMYIWFVFGGITKIAEWLLYKMQNRPIVNSPSEGFIIPIPFILLGYGLCMIMYKYEAMKSTTILYEIFKVNDDYNVMTDEEKMHRLGSIQNAILLIIDVLFLLLLLELILVSLQ